MADRYHRAIMAGTCCLCGEPYRRGDIIERLAIGKFCHPDGCPTLKESR